MKKNQISNHATNQLPPATRLVHTSYHVFSLSLLHLEAGLGLSLAIWSLRYRATMNHWHHKPVGTIRNTISQSLFINYSKWFSIVVNHSWTIYEPLLTITNHSTYDPFLCRRIPSNRWCFSTVCSNQAPSLLLETHEKTCYVKSAKSTQNDHHQNSQKINVGSSCLQQLYPTDNSCGFLGHSLRSIQKRPTDAFWRFPAVLPLWCLWSATRQGHRRMWHHGSGLTHPSCNLRTSPHKNHTGTRYTT